MGWIQYPWTLIGFTSIHASMNLSYSLFCVYQYPDCVIVSRLYVEVDWTYLIQL